MTEQYFVGVDVGTGSVRAALADKAGKILAARTQSTKTFRDDRDHRIFEQSTADIWDGICACIKYTISEAGVDQKDIKGIGFDATCSLAVTDLQGNSVTITKGKELGQPGDRNIILWADHRAEKEAELINGTGSIVLDYVGGTMSLEMEIPKILWLKNNMPPERFSTCQFFDLPDYLTYRATASRARSACSLTCKCSFVPGKGWQKSFFDKIGLDELVNRGYEQIGGEGGVLTAGMPVGSGLSAQAAKEMGLLEGTPVGSGVIDAYAGWIGTIAAQYYVPGSQNKQLSVRPTVEESRHRLAAVAGTSTCYLVQSPQGVFVNGVWGPYKDAIFPGWWMNEGGQSSTGQLIDFMITSHVAYPKLVERAEKEKKNIHQVLAEILEAERQEAGAGSIIELTKDLHLYPDLHGNRSPIADPQMRGAMMGLRLDTSLTDLALTFAITLEAISLQTKHIVEVMNKAGHSINSLYLSGGQAKNAKLMQLLADTLHMDVILPQSGGDAVTLGSAMLGRFAYVLTEEQKAGGPVKKREDLGDGLWKIMVEMTPPGTLVQQAASEREDRLLEAKYKIFLETIDIQLRWRREMEQAYSGN